MLWGLRLKQNKQTNDPYEQICYKEALDHTNSQYKIRNTTNKSLLYNHLDPFTVLNQYRCNKQELTQPLFQASSQHKTVIWSNSTRNRTLDRTAELTVASQVDSDKTSLSFTYLGTQNLYLYLFYIFKLLTHASERKATIGKKSFYRLQICGHKKQ